jgi:predicted GNAT family N-acyltransferase
MIDHEALLNDISKWKNHINRDVAEAAVFDHKEQGGDLFTIEEEGRLVAVMYCFRYNQHREHSNVYYVHEIASTKKGAGTELMKIALRTAANEDRVLKLWSLHTATSFYKRIGLKELDYGYFVAEPALSRQLIYT